MFVCLHRSLHLWNRCRFCSWTGGESSVYPHPVFFSGAAPLWTGYLKREAEMSPLSENLEERRQGTYKGPLLHGLVQTFFFVKSPHEVFCVQRRLYLVAPASQVSRGLKALVSCPPPSIYKGGLLRSFRLSITSPQNRHFGLFASKIPRNRFPPWPNFSSRTRI
jgi:hypothetical protein